MTTETILLIAETEASRIDAYLAANTDLTRSKIQKLIKDGAVALNGKACKASSAVCAGDSIRILVPETDGDRLPEPENITLDVVYEDDDLAVINKPKGMVVHPAPGNPSGTLVNALLYRFQTLSGAGGEIRPGIVHRIDRMTSGLLVVAKNDFAHEALARQFAEHTAHREYLCLVHGNLKEDSGTVDAPIGRHKTDRKRMAVTEDGRRAVTHWHVLERFGTETLLDVRLETGRTHQIRVHMAYIGHPLLGDTVYGRKKPEKGLDGQCLHAAQLKLIHPSTGEPMSFSAPLPDWFTDALSRLGPAE